MRVFWCLQKRRWNRCEKSSCVTSRVFKSVEQCHSSAVFINKLDECTTIGLADYSIWWTSVKSVSSTLLPTTREKILWSPISICNRNHESYIYIHGSFAHKRSFDFPEDFISRLANLPCKCTRRCKYYKQQLVYRVEI